MLKSEFIKIEETFINPRRHLANGKEALGELLVSLGYKISFSEDHWDIGEWHVRGSNKDLIDYFEVYFINNDRAELSFGKSLYLPNLDVQVYDILSSMDMTKPVEEKDVNKRLKSIGMYRNRLLSRCQNKQVAYLYNIEEYHIRVDMMLNNDGTIDLDISGPYKHNGSKYLRTMRCTEMSLDIVAFLIEYHSRKIKINRVLG